MKQLRSLRRASVLAVSVLALACGGAPESLTTDDDEVYFNCP
ncbi:hypothetical protein [Myxococcus sp. Y35]